MGYQARRIRGLDRNLAKVAMGKEIERSTATNTCNMWHRSRNLTRLTRTAKRGSNNGEMRMSEVPTLPLDCKVVQTDARWRARCPRLAL